MRGLWVGCSLCVVLYSIAVLAHVANMGSIGVRCMFGTKVEEEVPDDYAWQGSRPRIGDSLVSIGSFVIRDGSYSDYIRTLRGLSRQVGDTIEVRWRDQTTDDESLGPGESSISAVLDLFPFVRLVSPGAADLRHRCPRVLETAR